MRVAILISGRGSNMERLIDSCKKDINSATIELVFSNNPDARGINYAKENGMILVTRDTESGQACEENNIPCILLDNDEIFKIVLEKLSKFN